MAKQVKTSQNGLWLVKLIYLAGILCGICGVSIILWDRSSDLEVGRDWPVDFVFTFGFGNDGVEAAKRFSGVAKRR